MRRHAHAGRVASQSLSLSGRGLGEGWDRIEGTGLAPHPPLSPEGRGRTPPGHACERLQAVALALALAVAAGCRKGPAAGGGPPERVTNVRVQVLQPTAAEDRIEMPGTVEAWATVRRSAEVEGRLERMAVDEGDTVAAGQVVFEIDSAALKAQVKQAEGALAALKAEEEKVEAGARPEEVAIAEAKARGAEAAVNAAQAALAQAKAAEENAQRDLARTSQLFKDNVVPQDRVDAAQTAATIARKQREAAEEQLGVAEEQAQAAQKELALLRAGARREDREALAARVAQAEAALSLATIKFEKATVRAPVGGILNRRYADVGEYVQAGNALAEIVNIDRVKVVVPVPERDVPFVRTGELLGVVFDSLEARRTGAVIFVSRTADPRTLTFDVKIALDNPDGAIRPGMIGRVVLVRRRLPQAIAVPIFAVVRRDEGYVTFVENNGTAHERRVELGFFDADRVVVTAGLRPGDRLIVAGHRDLADTDRVRVIEAPLTTTAPARLAGRDRP